MKLKPEAKRVRSLSLGCLIVMILGSVGLDQLSKLHAEDKLMKWSDESDSTLYQGTRYPIWSIGEPSSSDSGEFYLSLSTNYVRNPGAAWGALAGLPDSIRVPFFYIVTIVAVVIIGLYMRATPVEHRLTRFALALILSGAIGNFIDRLRLGYVIDWIDVRWNVLGWRYAFPNFNVADSAITVGLAFMIFDMIVLESLRRKRAKGRPASSGSAVSAG